MSVARMLAQLRWRPAAVHAVRSVPHTLLTHLPLLAIDRETTGLDARRDRIVSIAAIRIAEGSARRRTVGLRPVGRSRDGYSARRDRDPWHRRHGA